MVIYLKYNSGDLDCNCKMLFLYFASISLKCKGTGARVLAVNSNRSTHSSGALESESLGANLSKFYGLAITINRCNPP